MNHDNEYHDNINYGNQFPDDWYFIRPEDSLNSDNNSSQTTDVN